MKSKALLPVCESPDEKYFVCVFNVCEAKVLKENKNVFCTKCVFLARLIFELFCKRKGNTDVS